MKRFARRVLSISVSFGVLAATIFIASVFNASRGSLTKDIEQAKNSTENEEKVFNTCESKNQDKPWRVNDKELKAVWIPFMDLQVKGEFSEQSFKQNYRNILDRVEKTKLNAVFVQIRPFSDALYPSKIFPWSHILTGVQGKNPGFDPLKFMVDETHSRNIEFHAWIVPMRIKNVKFPEDLSELNPCVKWKREDIDKFNKYVVEDKEYTYYDPEYDEVRKIISDGVKEVVEGYDIDGINFDDYFYPSNNLWVDKSYDEPCKKADRNDKESVIKRRKENINLLIKEIYLQIKSIKSDVVFGICPQGNFDNARSGGADIDTWAKYEGYVDYLCPEIYTNSVNPILPFDRAASDWRKLVSCDKVKLYAGLGLYKTGTSQYDKGTWLDSDDVIMKQIEHLRKEGYNGFSLYSSAYLDKEENKQEILNVMKIIN